MKEPIFIAREDTLEEKIIPAQLLNDYKLHGEKSFVFHMPELWEKMILHPYTANDIRLNGEALEYVLTIAIPGGKASLPNWLAMIYELADAAGQGLFTGIETVQQLVQSETAMAAVMNSETAMAAIANSKTSMTAIANSETAMAAVTNSETAMAAVMNSETAMAAVAGSKIAMTAVAASTLAVQKIEASTTALNAIINSPLITTSSYTYTNTWTKRRNGNIFLIGWTQSNSTSTSYRVEARYTLNGNETLSCYLDDCNGKYYNCNRFMDSITNYCSSNSNGTATYKYIPCG